MFVNADIVVKIVMVGLAFASFVTWTVWVAKYCRNCGLRCARRARLLGVLNEARSLGEAHQRLGRSDETGGAAAAHRRAGGAAARRIPIRKA